MTLAQLNRQQGKMLEIVNDLYEMRLDEPELGNNIDWLKSYADAMDNLHEAERALIEYYELKEYASKR